MRDGDEGIDGTPASLVCPGNFVYFPPILLPNGGVNLSVEANVSFAGVLLDLAHSGVCLESGLANCLLSVRGTFAKGHGASRIYCL